MKQTGLILVITGPGKGKTTSAFGLALRTAGWGKQVEIVQYFKKGQYGGVKAFKKFKNVNISQFGQEKMVNFENPDDKDRELAQKAWQKSKKIIEKGEVDLVVLDEINLAIKYELVNKNSVIKTIKQGRKEMSIVLTGRKADKDIINLADLVSRVEDIKHHFKKGVRAQKGIEY